jgi:hypothetical protein
MAPIPRRLSKNLAELKVLLTDFVPSMEKTLNQVTLHQGEDLEETTDRIYSDIYTLNKHKQKRGSKLYYHPILSLTNRN